MSQSESSPPRTAVLNIVGLTRRHIGEDTPFIAKFLERDSISFAEVKPTIPAVTSTMQATFLTGKTPGDHGIVGNMWYDRAYAEHRCWKQSNHLVEGRKLWEHIREERHPDFTCAKVFWWNNMYSSADYQITPRPIYCADGKKVFDIQTWPMNLRSKIKRKLGKFPFPAFWGPAAGIDSSRWIAQSAKWFEDKFSPHLNLVYLPHLDYNLQRLGPEDPAIAIDLREIDDIVRDLVTHLEKRGVAVVLLSEYGITKVDRPIHLNRLFREKGWLSWRQELKREVIDPGNCEVFAIPDHQVAHVYVKNPDLINEVAELLRGVEGITAVMTREMQEANGLAHERSGDLVVVSDERSWFTYYYWKSDRKAPDYARSVDIHRKPGYDPVELFVDPKIKFPKLKIAGKLLRKMLGFRMLMDVIPLDASLVKGSHGCLPESREDYPFIAGAFPDCENEEPIEATEVYNKLFDLCAGPENAE
ncbi:MAG: alkaline phosphatase family protein [Verrucomicrobiales bacterium]|nr:alkaline phosphatase family protein [Verrucomicrobiales bacterium]